MLDLLVLGVPVLDLPVIGSPLVDLPVAAGADVAGLPVAVALLRAVGVAGAALLVGAGVRHAVAPASVRALLRAHGIVPHAAVPTIAALLGPGEIALGALVPLGGVAGATLGSAPVVGLAAAAATALYVLFTAHLLRLLATRPGSPCGCLGGDEPVSPVAVGRAALLAVGCATIGLTSAQPLDVVTIAAGLLVAAVLWIGLPTAWSRAASR